MTDLRLRSSPIPGTIDSYTGVPFNLGYHARSYTLDITYRVGPNRLTGTAAITCDNWQPVDEITFDLADSLTVRKLSITPRDGGKKIGVKRWRHAGGKLRIRLDETLPVDREFTVTVAYAGTPRPIATQWGEIGWEELTEGSLVASQPCGAPSWFPCDDTPDEKATYDITVHCDAPFTVVANGHRHAPVACGGSMRTHRFTCDTPMATYLAAIHIGRYREHHLGEATITRPGGRVHRIPVTLLTPVDEDPAPILADFADQVAMVEFFSEKFGAYPFDSYTVVVTADDLEIPLEAQNLSVFGRNHARGDGAWERLIAHELAHQWCGNSAGLAQWNDIWLNEGAACYAEWLWFEHSAAIPAAANAARHHKLLARLPHDLVLADPGPALMFDDRVYKRGALVFHAMRTLLGDEAFFDALRAYFTAGRFSVVEPVDLRTAFLAVAAGANVTDREVSDLWDVWLHHPQLPDLPQARSENPSK